MKKILVGFSLCLLAPLALAESSVTLYGQVDTGLTVQKLKDSSTTVSFTNGNWYSTLWGIKGQEDLGNGNSVFFDLEQGFNIDNGTASNAGLAFGRQSYLGVSGDWGQVAFGRIGALGSDNGTYTIMGGSAYTTSFTSIGSVYSAFIVTDWMNNTIVYQSPEFSGFQLSAMYSNGIGDDSNTKWSTHDHYYGLGGTYSNGPFSANLYWEMLDNRTTVIDGAKPKNTNLFTLGASYDFGAFTLYGSYQYALHTMELPNYTLINSIDLPDGVALRKGANQHALSLSISAPLAGGTFMLQSQGAIGKIKDINEKYNSWSVGAAYLYPLSKRTLLYVDAAYGGTGKAFKAYNSQSELAGWNATVGIGHTF